MGIRYGLLLGLCVAACSGSTSPTVVAPADPMIEFTRNGASWNAVPVKNELDTVSNNGNGYTGEIDVYEITTPAPGRLQVSLSWTQAADFDVIVAADRFGSVRFVEGLLSGDQPEYVGLDVVEGQVLYVLVAGWEGEPGEYTLETILVPPETPVFDMVATSDVSGPVARNLPLSFFFNQDLDPDQNVAETLAFVATGHQAEGSWCIRGSELVFLPRLPEAPGDSGGLHERAEYTLQFRAAANGIRAATGEYLGALIGINVEVGTLQDEDPAVAPRVTEISHPLAEPWDGTPITITVLGALDPETIEMRLYEIGPAGELTPLPLLFSLQQQYPCIGGLFARLVVEPVLALPAAGRVRLQIPGTVRGITGDPFPLNRIAEGAGYSVDLLTR